MLKFNPSIRLRNRKIIELKCIVRILLLNIDKLRFGLYVEHSLIIIRIPPGKSTINITLYRYLFSTPILEELSSAHYSIWNKNFEQPAFLTLTCEFHGTYIYFEGIKRTLWTAEHISEFSLASYCFSVQNINFSGLFSPIQDFAHEVHANVHSRVPNSLWYFLDSW